jgi:small-conductance mechanosensitive channel
VSEFLAEPTVRHVLGTLVLILVTWLAWAIVSRAGKASMLRLAARSGKPDAESRALTLWGMLRRLLIVAIFIFVVFTVLAIWGVPLTGLVAVGGAVGVAVGLGAQNLVKDVIAGFFILAEGQYAIGDKVTVSGITGAVEEVRPRVTVVRDEDGNRSYIPNGSIVVTTNRATDSAMVTLDLPVPGHADLDLLLPALDEQLAQLAADHPEWFIAAPGKIVVDRVDGSGPVLRVGVRVVPAEAAEMQREGYTKLKATLDRLISPNQE